MNSASGTRWCRSCALGLLVAASGFVSRLPAHEDPAGDIHPQVRVEDGKFAIIFETALPDDDPNYTDARPVFRMVYTADGKLFAPRHPLPRKRSWTELGPVGHRGGEQRLGDTAFYFPEDRSGKPCYVLKAPGESPKRVRLPWPESVSVDLFEDALVVADGIAITGKEAADLPRGGPLKFYWFPHEVNAPPAFLTIGATACIYDFPVASNLAFAGGRFWLACMQPVGKDPFGKMQLAFWSWKPGEKEGRRDTSNAPAHWNSHLSLAAIGDRLCLAYHCEDQRHPRGQAGIVTVFRCAE